MFLFYCKYLRCIVNNRILLYHTVTVINIEKIMLLHWKNIFIIKTILKISLYYKYLRSIVMVIDQYYITS